MAALKVCYQLLCTNLGDGISCTLSPNHNIQGEMVFISEGQHMLWSQSVEMYFPAIWISKFTNLINSEKLNLWEKTAVDKSAWIKAW